MEYAQFEKKMSELFRQRDDIYNRIVNLGVAYASSVTEQELIGAEVEVKYRDKPWMPSTRGTYRGFDYCSFGLKLVVEVQSQYAPYMVNIPCLDPAELEITRIEK